MGDTIVELVGDIADWDDVKEGGDAAVEVGAGELVARAPWPERTNVGVGYGQRF